MKNYLLIAVAACSLLAAGAPTASAASKKPQEYTQEQINEMCKDREMCKMMIRGMTSNRETMMWMATTLKADPALREAFDNATTGGG